VLGSNQSRLKLGPDGGPTVPGSQAGNGRPSCPLSVNLNYLTVD